MIPEEMARSVTQEEWRERGEERGRPEYPSHTCPRGGAGCGYTVRVQGQGVGAR